MRSSELGFSGMMLVNSGGFASSLEIGHPHPPRGASLYQSGKMHKFYVRLGGLTTKRFRGLPKQ